MSKLSFRARALDATKAMPVYRSEEIPDLPDFAAINRAVPQMPTGMEKDEECETHLQRAMTAQQTYGHTGELVIPTPDVFPLEAHVHDKLYPSNFKLPKQLIYVQPLLAGLDDDTPEYDLDSEDEAWLKRQNGVRDGSFKLSALQLETMIDRLEKASGGHRVVQMNEAKLLLNHDDDVLIAVYDYWLNKRLKLKSSTLTPQIKTEKRDGSNSANPYVAFRRRTEKMQTRKNRKNDEASYEKMLKLKRDLKKAVTLLEMVKKREKLKKEDLNLTVEVFRERVQAGDFNGALVAETLQELARKKQQMQLAQAREREQLLGISLSSGGRGGAAAGRNSNNSNNNNNNNNGYAGSAANAHQIRELKAKHRKTAQGPRISSSSHKRQKDRGAASATDTRLAEHPSNGGAGAPGTALLTTIGREARTVETSGRCPLTTTLGGSPGTATPTPTTTVGPAGLTTQGTPGQGGQILADSASVGPLGPMLLSSDEDDDEALSSGAEERADAYTDMSHEPDGIFTFRRKRNVTYLAPLPFETTLPPLPGDPNLPPPLSLRPYEQVPRQEQFHLMSLQLESDDSDLSGHEGDDSTRSQSHSLIPRLDEATARRRALAVGPQPRDGQEYFMTFSGVRARALSTLPRPAGEAGVKRKRLDTNYLTLMGRRRLGRGGRIVFDRIRMSSPEASP